MPRLKKHVIAIGIVPLVLMLLAAGCHKDETPPAPGGTGGTGGAAQMAGGSDAVLKAQCRCHNGGKGAPDLSHEGAQHDASWIADHIKNPRTHNPSSRMPAFEGRMSDADIQGLATYLASQK